MVIPREAGLVRLYVQLQAEAGPDGKQKHYGRDASEDVCKERARKIFSPFKLEFGKTAWFSVYRKSLSLSHVGSFFCLRFGTNELTLRFRFETEKIEIGQRIASNYTLDHRVFLGGDATHTHSPKAGQG